MIEAAKLEADIYPAGPRGLSAYEIYKKEGGQLSEEEWLKSLNGLTPTIGENGNWFLGTVDTGLPSRGPKGDTGSIKFIVVTELPTENIDETAIYLKPVESPTGENKFEELIYVNGKWEDLGTPNVAVDLSNYYTKTEVKQITGELTNLNTADKSNLVNAINEAMESGGGITELTESPVLLQTLDPGVYALKNIAKIQFGDSSRVYNTGLTNGTYILFVTISQGDRYGKLFTKNYDIVLFTRYDWKSYSYTSFVENSNVLTKTNTEKYTPTSDYNPATKKYVDDAISSAITTSLEASY